MSHILHPELIGRLPFSAGSVIGRIDVAAEQMATMPQEMPDISVVIRSLNERASVEALLRDIHSQRFGGEIELIVVDNESDDGTAGMARAIGATVVTIPRHEYTHSYAMNLGVKAASYNHVFMTVGHALLSNNMALWAGMRHFEDPSVAGVFSYPPLPNSNATAAERFLLEPLGLLARTTRPVKRVRMGTMTATGSILLKSVWEDLGHFDESLKKGAEDMALARKMLAAGYQIIHDPLLRVHHTHGLGLIARAERTLRWASIWGKVMYKESKAPQV
jgi:glycosyltransferase involved in cell wall biosynthesis